MQTFDIHIQRKIMNIWNWYTTMIYIIIHLSLSAGLSIREMAMIHCVFQIIVLLLITLQYFGTIDHEQSLLEDF